MFAENAFILNIETLMDNFTRKLITEWRKLKLPFEDQNVLIAISGGADSCALAYALHLLYEKKKLENRFFAAHFNHKLRGAESDRDADFARDFSAKLGFKIICGEAERGEITSSENLEQSARNARYKFLKRSAIKKNCSLVLTAHTQNDQAETLLLNLLRGAGLEGLSGMQAVSTFFGADNRVRLVRPLLNWAKREDTESFCRENDIDFRDDSTNHDESFSRVKIRKRLIPELEEYYNPKAVETLAKTANLLREDAELIAEFISKETAEKDSLKIKKLKSLSKPMQKRMIRKWLENLRGDLKQIGHKHTEAIIDMIYSQKSGKEVQIPRKKCVIKEGGSLYFRDLKVEK